MQAVLDYLKRNQARFVAELCDYLRFPSVSAQPQYQKEMHACAAWLVDHCRRIGLDARLCSTAGQPIVVAKTPVRSSAFRRFGSLSPRKRGTPNARPHFMIYGHYDVQPPEPLELWKSPPFAPRIAGRSIYARGAMDNKGQNFAHLKAVEAYFKTGTPLSCDLTFVLEGEEEVGSANLAKFLKTHRAELNCDAVVVSDTDMPGPKHPALAYSLRGIIAFEITVRGPARDLHSGVFGGAVENPAMALARLLAQLRDAAGRVTIPGFYDDVAPLSAYERKQFARLPIKDRDLQNCSALKNYSANAASRPPNNAVRARHSRSTA